MNVRNVYHRLSPLLRPFSRPYSLLMRRRRRRYGAGAKRRYTPACPTVSVGNIAWGGSGKTPLVDWLLSWARTVGVKAVVLSRGYGASPGSAPLLVTADTPVSKSGDEPLLLAEAHPEAPIVVFPRRAKSARFAETRLSPDLFILDDGMQHLAVARDCDIVLLRPEDLTEQWNRVIPGGSWREGVEALRAASAFAMKIAEDDLADLKPLITTRLAGFSVPFFSFTLEPTGLRALHSTLAEGMPSSLSANGGNDGAGKRSSAEDSAALLSSFQGKPYLLVSGVGSPKQVETTAARLMGFSPARHMSFGDHRAYTEEDIRAILREAGGHSPSLPILCTAKDAVKLRPLAYLFQGYPLLVLETSLVFGPAFFTTESFEQWWSHWWQEHAPRRKT